MHHRPYRASHPFRIALALIAILSLPACGGDSPNDPDEIGAASIDVTAPLVNGLPRTSIGVLTTVQLTATVKDASGATINGARVTWSSDDDRIARVNTSGEVTGVSVGATRIRASVGSVEGSIGMVVSATPQAAAAVDMPGDTFSPAKVEIRVNERVAFIFGARAHNVIFDKGRAGLPADIQQTVNRVVDRQFVAAGTFPYQCTLHSGMVGEIVVR